MHERHPVADAGRPVRRAAGQSRQRRRAVRRWAASGDQSAFELFVWRHGPLVWAVCRRLLADRGDAEDAFQATFLLLVRKAA